MNLVHIKEAVHMPKKIDQPKETILKYAIEILEVEGYEGLNIRALAKKSGVSIGTIYNYFEDKQGLDMYLMLNFWNSYEQLVQRVLTDESQDFYVRLKTVADEMNRFVSIFTNLFAQLFQSRVHGYTEQEKGVKNQMIQRMAATLNAQILKENPALATTSPNSEEIASWIMNSLMMVNHMKSMDYEQLEKFIRKVMA